MGIFPTTIGVRPRLACELRLGGVVAARAEGAAGTIVGTGVAEFAPEALHPGLHLGNIVDRKAVSAAIKRALESAGSSSAGRNITLVIPDAAVRVTLLDFDVLPSKLIEALPVVRFRLKKLVPFEVDDASVSYQVMSSERGLVRVLAVAMPSAVLAEYESVVREAGFEPGAVLPSTLAALAGIQDSESSVLVVNAMPTAVTVAIVQSGILLLHRAVDLQGGHEAAPVTTPAPTGAEWEQDPVGYSDPIAAEAKIQSQEVARLERQDSEIHSTAREIAQAVRVAAAYFEDSLGFVPETVLSAGPLGVEGLSSILDGTGLKVREMVGTDAIAADAASVRRGLLAGMRGALRG